MPTLFGFQLLVQGRLAVVEQEVFVVLEIPLTAVFGNEGMGGGREGQLGDEDHHLLTLGECLLHEVEGRFQRGAGRLLGSVPGIRQGAELGAQHLESGVRVRRGGAQKLFLPAAQGLGSLQAGFQRGLIQQTGGALFLGLGLVVGGHLVKELRPAVRLLCQLCGHLGKGFLRLPQEGIAAVGRSVCPPGGREARLEAGQEEADKAQEAARAIFSNKTNTDNMPSTTLTEADFADGEIGILDLMKKCGLIPSNGEGRRLIQQGGVSVDDEKVTDVYAKVAKSDFEKGYVLIKKGKKVYHKAILG